MGRPATSCNRRRSHTIGNDQMQSETTRYYSNIPWISYAFLMVNLLLLSSANRLPVSPLLLVFNVACAGFATAGRGAALVGARLAVLFSWLLVPSFESVPSRDMVAKTKDDRLACFCTGGMIFMRVAVLFPRNEPLLDVDRTSAGAQKSEAGTLLFCAAGGASLLWTLTWRWNDWLVSSSSRAIRLLFWEFSLRKFSLSSFTATLSSTSSSSLSAPPTPPTANPSSSEESSGPLTLFCLFQAANNASDSSSSAPAAIFLLNPPPMTPSLSASMALRSSSSICFLCAFSAASSSPSDTSSSPIIISSSPSCSSSSSSDSEPDTSASSSIRLPSASLCRSSIFFFFEGESTFSPMSSNTTSSSSDSFTDSTFPSSPSDSSSEKNIFDFFSFLAATGGSGCSSFPASFSVFSMDGACVFCVFSFSFSGFALLFLVVVCVFCAGAGTGVGAGAEFSVFLFSGFSFDRVARPLNGTNSFTGSLFAASSVFWGSSSVLGFTVSSFSVVFGCVFSFGVGGKPSDVWVRLSEMGIVATVWWLNGSDPISGFDPAKFWPDRNPMAPESENPSMLKASTCDRTNFGCVSGCESSSGSARRSAAFFRP
eukprot:comp23174_c0_seq1/m.37531 comp23174_c0_seq1/g.37531  ORF comp23174_c0_seq1/g.37531 comp23174_c0_seq1/m.37531 type:complete len:597 (+) comp23174_c0_seq1:177-1967(+)